MTVTELQPSFLVLPGKQLARNRQVWFGNEMWFVFRIEFQQPLHRTQRPHQFRDLRFGLLLYINGMRGKSAKIFQLYYK